MNKMDPDIKLSVVMPCLNEEQTIMVCVNKALDAIKRMGIAGEVVIADNGSTDKSIELAQSLGARVIKVSKKGYGNALIGGINAAYGEYIIMGDADDSYDFSKIDAFVAKLDEGYELVMGTRLRGKIEKGAMSRLHRIGNPIMTWFLNLLYKTAVSDINCGLRGFRKDSFKKLNLKCGGMEFASEFVIKAAKEKLKIAEVPITLHKDGRDRRPHLRTFVDGWRHLRLLLIYCPTFLYLIPGIFMLVVGLFIQIRGLFSLFYIGPFRIDYHVSFFAAMLAISGFQLCMLGIWARSFAYIKGFDKYDNLIKKVILNFSLEKSIITGLAIMAAGAVLFLFIIYKWILAHGAPLFEVRKGILGVTLISIGFQYISSSFFLSMLLMEYPIDSGETR